MAVSPLLRPENARKERLDMKKTQPGVSARKTFAPTPRCGLCGSTTKPLTRTPCCGNWICDDEEDYVLFSFAHNSCHRNHNRYTLCSSHHNEGHKGRWQDCPKCRKSFETEMYVWYGTNDTTSRNSKILRRLSRRTVRSVGG